MDVLLLHGYNVTSTKTYGHLPARLKSLGIGVKHLHLAKYVTLDDSVTVQDLILGFNGALRDLYGASWGKKKFACITHSTGGMIARAWVDSYGAKMGRRNPMTHLVMLSPPNNGSRLASVSKAKMSRFRARLGVEPGVHILNALQLASPFEWNINSVWMKKKTHQLPGFYPFVITGQWIDIRYCDVLVPASYEKGSDGTVRASAANLNMQKVVVDAKGIRSTGKIENVPFLIAPKTSHGDIPYGIVEGIPASPKKEHTVLSAIKAALQVSTLRSYEKLEAEFAARTHALQIDDVYHDRTKLDRYSQVVFHVVDDQGNGLSDYAIEWIDSEGRGDRLPMRFLEHQHKNTTHPDYFSFYLNFDQLTELREGKLGFTVHAPSASPLVSYEDLTFQGPKNAVGTLVKPNQTTLIEVVLRRKLNKNLFRLTKNTHRQKISTTPSRETILTEEFRLES